MPVIPPEGAACNRCGEWRAQSDFYLRNQTTGNRYGWCAACHTVRTMGHAPNTWGKDSLASEKRCIRCEQMLPVESFAVVNSRTGLRRERCRPCHNAASLEYKNANREKVRAQNRAAYAANPDAAKTRVRKHRESHPERYRQIHSTWKHLHPEAVNAMGRRRYAKVRENGGSHTQAEWEALKLRYERRCLMCARQEPQIQLTVDHITPIDLGGSDSIENIQPLCGPCNSKKHRGIVDLRPERNDEQ